MNEHDSKIKIGETNSKTVHYFLFFIYYYMSNPYDTSPTPLLKVNWVFNFQVLCLTPIKTWYRHTPNTSLLDTVNDKLTIQLNINIYLKKTHLASFNFFLDGFYGAQGKEIAHRI